MKLGGRKMEYILMEGLSLLHEVHVVHRLLHQCVAAVFAYPEDESPVVEIGVVHQSVVGYSRRHYHQIPGAHPVLRGALFSCKDLHGDIPFDEEIAFVVVVRMRSYGSEAFVRIVVDFKV